MRANQFTYWCKNIRHSHINRSRHKINEIIFPLSLFFSVQYKRHALKISSISKYKKVPSSFIVRTYHFLRLRRIDIHSTIAKQVSIYSFGNALAFTNIGNIGTTTTKYVCNMLWNCIYIYDIAFAEYDFCLRPLMVNVIRFSCDVWESMHTWANFVLRF